MAATDKLQAIRSTILGLRAGLNN